MRSYFVVGLFFLPSVLSTNAWTGSAANVTRDQLSVGVTKESQRQLTSVEDLRQVALDFPSCGVRWDFGYGSTGRRYDPEFSDNTRQYYFGGGLPADPDNARSLFGYSITFFRYHFWAPKEFKYTMTSSSLDGVPLRVQLGFVENYTPNCVTGRRVFSATVNGEPFFTDLDVYDTVGCNTILLIAKDIVGDASNTVEIAFKGTVQNPMVSTVEVRSRTGCNDPCPCWTQGFVDEHSIQRVSVNGVRAGDQTLKAWTGTSVSRYFEMSKERSTDGGDSYQYKCRYAKSGSTPKLPLTAEQADSCRNLLRPVLEDYYEARTTALTQTPLPTYCTCWGSEQTARDTQRTSCYTTPSSGSSWRNYGQSLYSSADSDVRMR